ncbi:MAG: cytochrome-c oxidase, cbb3-type subunit III [Proteobacteria bacterium]|nr:MAG: cytochrome-c oxidase, cbb3-type subunit III [Pseudomonadota bacterium]
MGVIERDPHTGQITTGHEWNGIKELNSPVPKVIYLFLAVTVLFAVTWWVLMPTWPLGTTYTRGLLGVDQREIVTEKVKAAAAGRDPWTRQIAAKDFKDILADASLMRTVRATGHTLFGDNCAACHGLNARGSKGFPNLTSDSWLWGGSPEAIYETIRVGINSAHPETRTAQMPAFGRDQMLPRADIDKVITYVQSLSDSAAQLAAAPDVLAAGKELFAANCASCHGEDGKGNQELGAPDLTDRLWIYGGDRQTLLDTLWAGRQGHMPTWETRLSEVDRKILALYLFDKRAKP